jgi:hypothetical protein
LDLLEAIAAFYASRPGTARDKLAAAEEKLQSNNEFDITNKL